MFCVSLSFMYSNYLFQVFGVTNILTTCPLTNGDRLYKQVAAVTSRYKQVAALGFCMVTYKGSYKFSAAVARTIVGKRSYLEIISVCYSYVVKLCYCCCHGKANWDDILKQHMKGRHIYNFPIISNVDT